VVEVVDELQVLAGGRGGLAHRERQHRRIAVRLGEDTATAAQGDRVRSPKPRTPQRPEVVVERAVLLHQEDHVPQRAEPAWALRSGQRRVDRRGQQRRAGGSARHSGAELEQVSPGDLGHGSALSRATGGRPAV